VGRKTRAIKNKTKIKAFDLNEDILPTVKITTKKLIYLWLKNIAK